METALIDFEQWVKTLPVQQISYWAVFDPASGEITGIYPDHSCPTTNSKISIDDDTAQSILEGRTSLNSYVVDVDSGSVEIIETKSLIKIDDVLHRVIDQRWSSSMDFDVMLSADLTNNKLTISLAEKFYLSRKILWDGSTEMLFLITDYNDPNALHDTVSVTIDQLHDAKAIVYSVDFPREFSVYTRRIFKTYILTNENN